MRRLRVTTRHRHAAPRRTHRHAARRRPWRRRPGLLAGLVVVTGLLAMSPSVAGRGGASTDCGRPTWVGAWGASPQKTAGWYAGRTVRNVVRLQVGGDAVRVRLTNALGALPLPLSATLARSAGGPAVEAATLRALTVSGSARLVVPPGGSVLSDPVPLAVRPGEALAVSVAFPPGLAPTVHDLALTRSWVTGPGNFSRAGGDAYAASTVSSVGVSAVDVHALAGAAAVVALGDSLTAGLGTPVDADQRWTDDLAAVLARRPGSRPVVNAAISGNYLLSDDPSFGLAAVHRVGRDVLSVTEARDAVVLVGLNDFARVPGRADADAVVRGLTDIVEQLHAAGLRVTGATLPPTGDAGAPASYGDYSSPRSRSDRAQVNRWVRAGGVFDAVADVDAALRDPAHPERLRPAYDAGDRLHLSPAGYAALAGVVAAALPPGPCG